VRETPYQGPQRRRFDRSPPMVRVLGRARLRAEHASHALSLERERWYDIVELPADVLTPTLEGYVWIDLNGRPQSVWAAFLEIERW
jgi:hypothetical protein